MENRPGEGSHHDDPVSLKLDRLLDRFNKLDVWRDETDRRFDNLETALSRVTEPPLGYEDREEFDDDDFRQKKPWERGYRSRHPTGKCREGSSMERDRREGRGRTSNNWYPSGSRVEVLRPPSWPNPESPYVSHHLDPPDRRLPARKQDRDYQTFNLPQCSETCWNRPHPQEEVRALRVQPASHHYCYTAEQPPRDLYSLPACVTSQTPDQLLRSPTFWDPAESNKFIGSEKQRGLHTIPSLKVRSPCLAQLATVSDYNEKLRIYRLEQVALLAQLKCIFEENIDDESLVEDVPNNAAHNGGATLDVPNDEAMEEIVKADNMPLHRLVGVYDEKIGEEEETLLEDKEENGSIGAVEKIIASFNVAQMSLKDVVNCWFKTGGACTGVRIIAYFYVDFFDGDVPSIVHHSASLDVDARFIPPCNVTPYLRFLGGDNERHSAVQFMFDPGGDASLQLLLSTLIVGLWFLP